MTNNQINSAFFAAIPAVTKNEILNEISKHYGISVDEAFEEVTHEQAEHLLDYVTSIRNAVNVLMQKHGLR